MKERKELSYEIIDDLGIVEEHPSKNNAITLRKASWGNREAKLEIREVNIETGTPYKGISLYTPEGYGKLCEILIKNGFIKKSRLLELIKEMPDDNDNIEEAKVVETKTYSKMEMLQLD